MEEVKNATNSGKALEEFSGRREELHGLTLDENARQLVPKTRSKMMNTKKSTTHFPSCEFDFLNILKLAE